LHKDAFMLLDEKLRSTPRIAIEVIFSMIQAKVAVISMKKSIFMKKKYP